MTTARLEIVLSPELKAAGQAAADRYGITLSAYLRVLIGLSSGFDPDGIRTISLLQAAAPAPKKKTRRRRS